MIQFNLLPDVKIEYIKAQRTRRTMLLASIVVCAVSLTMMALLFVGVQVFQRNHLNDLSADIKKESNQLEGTQDIAKILTIQNQLNVLPTLHAQKPVASRLSTYIAQVTPKEDNINLLNVDFNAKTLSISGTADAISSVNKYADSLKFTTYKTAVQTQGKNAFTGVTLASYSTNNKTVSYTLTMSYDPAIFDSTNDVQLSVPTIISTRSETEKPNPLFNSTSGSGQ